MTTAAVDTKVAVARLIEFLETGKPPAGLFAPDVFLDLSLPYWRAQTDTAAAAAALVRRAVTLKGNRIAEEFQSIVDDYVRTTYGR